MKKKNVGSSFDDWLREEGLYEETTSVAIKRVLARFVTRRFNNRRRVIRQTRPPRAVERFVLLKGTASAVP